VIFTLRPLLQANAPVGRDQGCGDDEHRCRKFIHNFLAQFLVGPPATTALRQTLLSDFFAR